MAKQTFTTGQVLTAAQVNSLQANDFNQTVSVKTASYTLVAADKGTRIEFNTSGSVTCTVNTGIFDAGDTVIIQNRGAGTVTVTAGTATVNTNASLAVAQYGYGTLYFISASASIFFADAGGIPASAFTAKGDVLVGTGSGTYDDLTVGTNGHVLTADSSTSTGLKWAAAAGGGKVLQVVSATTTTQTTITSTSLTDTGISATITPSSATSKILMIISAQLYSSKSAEFQRVGGVVLRGATTLMNYGTDTFVSIKAATLNQVIIEGNYAVTYLDSPSTTSATTYKLQARLDTTASSSTVIFQNASAPSTITLLEIGA